jgi:hypothetical protein
MRLTARRLNRATLARQLLLRREPLEVAEAVRRVLAFLAVRDPAVYRRFAYWWKELPAAEVRLLPA